MFTHGVIHFPNDEESMEIIREELANFRRIAMINYMESFILNENPEDEIDILSGVPHTSE